MESKCMELHNKGYNCAQSVFGALTDITGMSEEEAFAITGGFGGGMRAAEICGTVSGAVMALSIAFPSVDANDRESKEKIKRVTREFHKRFKKDFNSLICRELIGYDMEVEGYKPEVNEKYCPVYIKRAVQIVHDIIEEYKDK